MRLYGALGVAHVPPADVMAWMLEFSVADLGRRIEEASLAGLRLGVGAHLLPTSASEAVLGRLRPRAPAPGGSGEATAGPQSALGNRKGSTPVTAPAPPPSGASPHPAC
jgi:hypothetical protein